MTQFQDDMDNYATQKALRSEYSVGHSSVHRSMGANPVSREQDSLRRPVVFPAGITRKQALDIMATSFGIYIGGNN